MLAEEQLRAVKTNNNGEAVENHEIDPDIMAVAYAAVNEHLKKESAGEEITARKQQQK